MTYLTTVSNDELGFWWKNQNNHVIAMKRTMEIFVADGVSRGIGWDRLEGIYTQVRTTKTIMERAAAIGGIGPYAKQQLGGRGGDWTTELVALIGFMDDFMSAIVAETPKDADGWLLVQKTDLIDKEDGLEYRQFSPAQSTGLRAKAQAIIAAIA